MIFLGGGGTSTQSERLDQQFALARRPGRVVYVPSALAEPTLIDGAIEWFLATYAGFGIADVVAWKRLDGRNLNEVPNISAVYLGGGNTYHLVAELRRTGLLSEITTAARNGLPIYGGSAGAIALGADISTAHFAGDINTIGLSELRGMDALNGWSVSCHYNETQRDAIVEWCADRSEARVIALSEDGGATVTDGRIQNLGSSPVRLIRSNGIVNVDPGESAPL